MTFRHSEMYNYSKIPLGGPNLRLIRDWFNIPFVFLCSIWCFLGWKKLINIDHIVFSVTQRGEQASILTPPQPPSYPKLLLIRLRRRPRTRTNFVSYLHVRKVESGDNGDGFMQLTSHRTVWSSKLLSFIPPVSVRDCMCLTSSMNTHMNTHCPFKPPPPPPTAPSHCYHFCVSPACWPADTAAGVWQRPGLMFVTSSITMSPLPPPSLLSIVPPHSERPCFGGEQRWCGTLPL